MKIGQLIDIPRKTFFFKNHAENEAGRLVPELFLFFKKALYKSKSKWSATWFHLISIVLNLAYNKTNCVKL